ncbi:MAG: class I mannose-6-phosphate isomerase [Tannerella sp.]|jgi:mannose-6-phosphate isomerase|nr:class I mannose-6-phosphate isomerase [Tannerella sp.]
MKLSDYSYIPLQQLPNRVWRTYNGGFMIDKFHHNNNPADSDTPEEWIMSTVTARGDNRPENEGVSLIITKDGAKYLPELIASDPEGFLGKKRETMGVLIKLLDACERLTIQVHPDKDFARHELNSSFGKTEGWYILGTRNIEGENAYVLFGFKEGITKEKWEALFNEQDINGMRDCLHKVYVKSGDVFIIKGGMPHAIGEGCFMLEIQEPTDYTMRVEKTTPRGLKVSEALIHQGVGNEKMLNCFHYNLASSLDTTLSQWQAKPLVIDESPGATVLSLLDERYTDCFSLRKIIVRSHYAIENNSAFYIMIVISGQGTMTSIKSAKTTIHQGNSYFIPANVGKVTLTADSEMQLLVCLPPTL